MAVRTYSLSHDSGLQLSAHFMVKEFACRDGTDEIRIDDALVSGLEAIRAHFVKPVSISSGFRSSAYNKRIKGAEKSQHLYGAAADIRIAGVKPRAIAQFAETLGLGGIGLYEYSSSSGFCHVDVREKEARWLQTTKDGGATSVKSFAVSTTMVTGATKLWHGCNGDAVKDLQALLSGRGYGPLSEDGKFGDKTEAAVKAFQKANELTEDGIVGPKTSAALGVKG